jgi:DNA (cytosine-5)-methyltransferase 1
MTNIGSLFTGYGANLHEVSRGMEAGTFGVYEQAIARWEHILGRPAPAPTVPATREGGRARLSTKFVEWLMGLPEGHVTGEDLGLTREQQLRLLGNGVVPQQGAAAIYQLTKIALKEAA